MGRARFRVPAPEAFIGMVIFENENRPPGFVGVGNFVR